MSPAADALLTLPEAATMLLPEAGIAGLAAIVLFYAWRGLAQLPLLPRLLLGLAIGVIVPVSFGLVVLTLSPSGGLPWLKERGTAVAVAPEIAPPPAPRIEIEPPAVRPQPEPAVPRPAPVPPPSAAVAPAVPQAPAVIALDRGQVVEVLYGTDRARTAEATATAYTAGRARRLELGRAIVAETAAASGLRRLEPSEFAHDAGADEKGGEPIVVVVHGYNTSLPAAARVAGALLGALRSTSHGAEARGFVYGWPSAGIASYSYDLESAAGAAPHLREFLDLIARAANGRPMSIVAFDMGAEPLLVALAEGPPEGARLKEIVLVAPDIAASALADRLARVSHPVRGPRVTLIASADERALVVSRRFHGGGARAGDTGPSGPLAVVPDADIIDATPVAAMPQGERSLDSSPPIIADIARLIVTGKRAAERQGSGLLAARTPDGRTYWRLPRGPH